MITIRLNNNDKLPVSLKPIFHTSHPIFIECKNHFSTFSLKCVKIDADGSEKSLQVLSFFYILDKYLDRICQDRCDLYLAKWSLSLARMSTISQQ